MLNLNKHTKLNQAKPESTLISKNSTARMCVCVGLSLCTTVVHKLHNTVYGTILIIFPLILQTIIIAQMTFTGGEGAKYVLSCPEFSNF